MNNEQHNTISRAQFLRTAGLISIGTMIAPREIFAQTSPVITIKNEAAKASVTSQMLRANIHLLQGSGGNIAVFNGKEGKLMVDAGIAVSQKKILSALAGIGNKPLKYLVNTHWHFDHAEGNEWIPKQGAIIIAHSNTRKNLAKAITVKDWNYTFAPSPKAALPEIVFQDDYHMKFNGSDIQMRYYQPCHTNSDISIYFPDADVLHVGDTWWNAHYPFIDHDSGGTIDGMIAAADSSLAIATDKTMIIPGHGAVGNRNELVQFQDMLGTIREKVMQLKKEGRSMQQTVDAKPTAPFDERYGKFVLNGDFFTRLVYADV